MDSGGKSYEKYLGGDDKGMAEIINDYFDGLTLFLSNYVDDIETAADIAQETMVKLAVKKPRYSGKASFKTWLYTIGRNKAVDYLRKNRRALSAEDLSGESADELNLENEYIKKENARAVRQSMKKLGRDYRQALWLVYFEDMTAKQASEVMGKSLSATQSLIHRAKAALREQLAKDGFTYEDS